MGIYAASIVGLFTSPKYIFHTVRLLNPHEPPWFFSKAVYVPLLAVALLGVFHKLLAVVGVHILPLVSVDSIVRVLETKYTVVFLILAFAFLSVSLDRSGFFAHAAYRIIIRARGQGMRLFVLLYLLCSALTFFTSNDIVVLSMTPIILHVGRQAGIRNLVPLLISQFIAANTLSMGLYIGSPTNIVLGDAAGMTFLDFFLWMFVPALVACLVSLGVLVTVFHWYPLRGHRMQASYHVPADAQAIPASPMLATKVGLFALSLGLMTASSWLRLDLWFITLTAALAMLGVDFVEIRRTGQAPREFALYVIRRIPWGIAPFVFSFFVLVDALDRAGFTRMVAEATVQLTHGSLVGSALVYGYLSALAVNVMNDIPSTVFWAQMLPQLQQLLPAKHFHSALLAIIVGVNPGCYLTLIGALAGLMWINILKTWKADGGGVEVPTGWDLSFYGSLTLLPVIFVTCLVVVVEVVIAK